jgi:hypothetical protein
MATSTATGLDDILTQDIREFLASYSRRLRHLVQLEVAAELREAAQYRLLRSLFVDRTLTFDQEADAVALDLVREAIAEMGLGADFLALNFELELVATYYQPDNCSERLDTLSVARSVADMHCHSAANFAGEALPCESAKPLLTRADVGSIVQRRQSAFKLHRSTSVACVLVGHMRDAMML